MVVGQLMLESEADLKGTHEAMMRLSRKTLVVPTRRLTGSGFISDVTVI